MRGDGTLVLRRGIWYARHYRAGRRIEDSLHTADLDVAKERAAVLRRKRVRAKYVEPTQRRITFDELLDDVLLHLEVKGAASHPKAKPLLKAMRAEVRFLAEAGRNRTYRSEG